MDGIAARPEASESFPQDVLDFKLCLGRHVRIRRFMPSPVRIPTCRCGFWAPASAALSLLQCLACYAFASHFAPQAVMQAIAVYRERFVSAIGQTM